jgi:acetylornithine/N-succinyldiaminopimelate aminotransferase
VFFCNSGAEANEAAIKIARLYGHKPRPGAAGHHRHGRQLSRPHHGDPDRHRQPQGAGRLRAAAHRLRARAVQRHRRRPQIAANTNDMVAVLVEPVLGEGGIVIPDDDYLATLRRICDEHGWLLMLDEVQTGNGRTGRYFAYQHTGILPDVVTTAKGLGNGVPIGACLARGEAAETFAPGNHGSTFGGNPLACAAANAVLDALEQMA